MCFSATASFVAAGVTGAIGLLTLRRVETRADIPLAAMPLFFAVQQTIEGMLWTMLPVAPDAPQAATLTLLFVVFAKIFWPIYAPWAPLLVEPDITRRRWMKACLFMGTAVGLYFLWSIARHPVSASIADGHIAYSGEVGVPVAVVVAYFVATAVSPGLSSHKPLRLFAAIVGAGAVVSYIFYWEAFSSTWCFFAAAASVVIVVHFEQARQARQSAVVASLTPLSSPATPRPPSD